MKVVQMNVQPGFNNVLARRVLKAHEEERNHIGRELHDNVNQILAGACIYLQHAANERPDLIDYPMNLLRSAIHEIRNLSRGYVMEAADIDLKDMLEELLEHAGRGVGFDTTLNYEADSLCDDGLKLQVYRIVQEQINNVCKYACATKVTVSVTTINNKLEISIRDNGRGFDTTAKKSGIGLSNIKSRLRPYRGKLQIVSAPGEGCALDIQIPIARVIKYSVKNKLKALA